MKKIIYIGLIVAISLFQNLLSSSSFAKENTIREIAMVTHADFGDYFWHRFKNSANKTAAKYAVKIKVYGLHEYGIDKMLAQLKLLEKKKPYGLIVSVPNATTLKRPLRNLTDIGTRIVIVDTGLSAIKKVPNTYFIGDDPVETSRMLAKKLLNLGARNLLCINDDVENLSNHERCEALNKAFKSEGGNVLEIHVRKYSPATESARISAAFIVRPEIDSVLTLDSLTLPSAITALEETHRLGKIKLSTFGVTPLVIKNIRKGIVDYAVYQEPILQANLAVSFLNASDDISMTNFVQMYVNDKNAAHYSFSPINKSIGTISNRSLLIQATIIDKNSATLAEDFFKNFDKVDEG